MSLLLDKLFKDNPPNESIEKTIEKTILFLDTFSYGDEWDDLPKEYISLANKALAPTGFMARRYLKERGITKKDIILIIILHLKVTISKLKYIINLDYFN